MRAPPAIDRTIVKSIVDSIENFESDIEHLLDSSGLARDWFGSDTEMLPEDRVWKLFEVSGEALDLPDVGLRVGAYFQIGDLGTFGQRLESGLTAFSCLTEYIKTVNRYSTHSRFWFATGDDGVWFCRRGIDLIEVGRSEVEQFTLELMIRLVQLACGPAWMPLRIAIMEDSDQFYRDNARYDSVEIRCGEQQTAVWISQDDLIKSVQWKDDEIINLIRDSIEISQTASKPTVELVAARLGFSVRTLQRELSLQGLDWTRLLDQLRLSLAIKQLRTDVPLAEIAQELHYTDQANFGRAFRRWTGTTPQTYRSILKTDPL